MDFTPGTFFDYSHFQHKGLVQESEPAWNILKKIHPYLNRILQPNNKAQIIGQPYIAPSVFIDEETIVEHGAVILGPAWIGKRCHIRTGAYIRENVIVGDDCILGNSCEFKNCLLMNGCQVPHFSYVGDSILGNNVHLGAGVILSNLRLTGDEVIIRYRDQSYPTGLRKFGAIIGDHSQIGCHAVLNPGSILGRRCLLYPGTLWRGVLEAEQIVKNTPSMQIWQRRRA
jgi:NDP-sugar pyrophosphorylase family protein